MTQWSTEGEPDPANNQSEIYPEIQKKKRERESEDTTGGSPEAMGEESEREILADAV